MSPNKTLLITLILIAASFGLGCRNYSFTKQEIISDLNQALQKSIAQNMGLWMSQDSIHTYAHLQEIMGAPVSVNTSNQSFIEALRRKELKNVSGISFSIWKKNQQTSTLNTMADDYLVSDTLLWISPEGEASSDFTLAFRGYAQCSPTMILSFSDQWTPTFILLIALLFAATSWNLSRKTKNKEAGDTDSSTSSERHILFGNLELSMPDSSFYNEHKKQLKLTPLQYSLMEMFFLSSSHQLSKSDICQSLWPGKENADETLYTLIRRLKPIIEENSNLKITTDRGRAYHLEIQS